MAQDLLRIRQFLARLRRRAAALGLAELLLFWGTLTIALVLLAAALGGLYWTHASLPAAFWLLLIGLPAAWLFLVTLPRYRRVHQDQAAARYVDARVPELRNATLSAIELAPGGAFVEGYSQDLIQAAVHATAARVQALSPSELLPLAPIRPWVLAFVTAGALFLILSVKLPGQIEADLQAFFHPPVSAALPPAVMPATASEGPALGDITLTLTYPAYLNRQTEVLENSNGEITAPVGTQVAISARSSIKPAQARLEVLGATPAPAAIAPDGRFTAAFTVVQKGTYRFVLTPAQGAGQPIVSRTYPIEVEPDGSPTIEVHGLEATNEVAPNQPLPFSFSAADDHGVSRVDIVVEGPKGQNRKVLREIPAGHDRDEGDVSFYPGEWDIPQGGTVELWLEVRDDDTVSGPKVGKSARYKIALSSPERRREQALHAKEQLKEAMIATLGDALVHQAEPARDKTAGTYAQEMQALTQDMTKVTDAFKLARAAMEDDANEEKVVYRAALALEKEVMSSWEPLHDALRDRTTGPAEGRSTVSGQELKDRRGAFITAFERGILSMESFANLQRMESILTRGEEMRKSGEELRDMLEELKKSGKQPDMKALLAKLDAMEQKMQQMAQQLSKLDRSSAEWFQNPTGEVNKVQDTMAEIRDLLKQGKTEEARKKLEDYLKATDQLMNQLKDMQKEEFGDDRQEMVKDMEGAINGLKEIENQQKKLLADTQATREGLNKRSGLSPEKLEQMTKEALKKLDSMKGEASRMEESIQKSGGKLDQDAARHLGELKDRMQTLEAALKARDFGKSLRESYDSARNFRMLDADAARMEGEGQSDTQEARGHAQQGRKAAEALAKDLENVAEKIDQMQSQAAGQGQGLGSRQESVRQKGEALGQRLKEYSKGSPMIPSQWGERLQKAGKAMQAASGKLSGGELGGGQADQQMALQELGEVRKEMEQAQKEMAQKQRGNNPGSMPMAMGQQPGQGKPGQSENWGKDSSRTGKVDISKEFRAPEAYRREIMEGMKGDAPERYKRLNREYYEKLVK